MLDMAAAPATVERLGTAARDWALAHSWELVADAVEAHLQALVEGREPDVATNHSVT
jgi:hypothetical protein